jgi:hypothetical protein
MHLRAAVLACLVAVALCQCTLPTGTTVDK